MIHNIIKVDGVEYQAVMNKHTDYDNCKSCALNYNCPEEPLCTPHERRDNQDVIYKLRININDIGSKA